jgi:hypothetical protein
MAVRCGGDPWRMEQLGEKQDFECELSRLGFKHEDFVLDVRHARALGAGTAWTANYAVRVTNIPTARRIIYWGGPREHWVEEFAVDAANGIFGQPTIRQPRQIRGQNPVLGHSAKG